MNGRNRVDAQTWFTAIGSQSGLPQYYTYSATNIRLQEAATVTRFHVNGCMMYAIFSCLLWDAISV